MSREQSSLYALSSPSLHCPETKPFRPSYIEKIKPEDKALFKETVQRFRPNSKNYEDSWGYLIQATRHGGFKWHDPQSGSLIFFGRKSESDSTLVVPSFFAEPEYLTQVIDTIQGSLQSSPTILKNIDPEDIPIYLAYGFRQYRDGDGWCPEARFDDQTYPQQVINLQKLMRKTGKEYHHLRKALNKKPDVTVRAYCEEDEDSVQEIFSIKDENSNDSYNGEGGMFLESHAMYPTADIDKFVTIDNQTGEIVGFSATSDISRSVTASVASQFRPDAIKSRIWSNFQIWAKKYEEGVQEINLGGSEFESTYDFRRRTFRPVELIEKTHLVYDP